MALVGNNAVGNADDSRVPLGLAVLSQSADVLDHAGSRLEPGLAAKWVQLALWL